MRVDARRRIADVRRRKAVKVALFDVTLHRKLTDHWIVNATLTGVVQEFFLAGICAVWALRIPNTAARRKPVANARSARGSWRTDFGLTDRRGIFPPVPHPTLH